MIWSSLFWTVLWLALALGLWPIRHRRWPGVLLLVAGVPVLGLLTYDYGPLTGLAGLAAGAVLLRLRFIRLPQRVE